jgi:DNA-binding LytR/AlgR family response regulator
MIKIAFIEDDKKCSDILKVYLNSYSKKYFKEFSSSLFIDGESFLLSESNFDIVCFDIDLPGINGMDTAKKLREKNPDCVIIFITNLAQYAIQGYQVDALDFAVKPLSYPDFEMKINKALRYLDKTQNYQISITTIDNNIVVLNTNLITYLEVNKHYITYHTSKKDYVVRGSMKTEEKNLNYPSFFRINNGFLVNMKYITSIDNFTIYVGSKALPLSRSRKSCFLSTFASFIGGYNK